MCKWFDLRMNSAVNQWAVKAVGTLYTKLKISAFNGNALVEGDQINLSVFDCGRLLTKALVRGNRQ